MRHFATIDTNVLVSALLNAKSIPRKVVQDALSGNIMHIYNDEILREYNEVLRRIKFRFKREIIELTVDAIIKRGFAVDAGPIEDVLPDPKDVVFYAVTLEQKKQDDAYLVTGNIKHFPKVNFVVTPREMLDIIENERNE